MWFWFCNLTLMKYFLLQNIFDFRHIGEFKIFSNKKFAMILMLKTAMHNIRDYPNAFQVCKNRSTIGQGRRIKICAHAGLSLRKQRESGGIFFYFKDSFKNSFLSYTWVPKLRMKLLFSCTKNMRGF